VDTLIIVLAVLVALGVGTGIGYLLRRVVMARRRGTAEAHAAQIIAEAEEKHRKALLEAREESLKLRSDAEKDIRERLQEIQRQDRRRLQREEALEQRITHIERREQAITQKEQQHDRVLQEVEELKAQQVRKLEEIASITQEQAREQIFQRAEEQAQHEISRRYFELEQEMQQRADRKAREMVAMSIQRLATDVVSESTTSAVPLPNDDMKGRLIGREGRNIRALEALTGVDIIVDDTPEVVTISCFDPVRREVARLALQKLIMDGRIHPARIEEMVERSQKEVEESIQQEGEKAVFEVGVRGLHPELVKLLGRLRYRYSYGENVLKHSQEVAFLSGMLAGEVRANVEIAKLAGLLHDIGKALSHETDGAHAEVGAEAIRRYGVPEPVIRAIKEHHDTTMSSIEGFLVAAADAISAARPGARKESLEQYVHRLETLEKLARDLPGIDRAFAIQAGRELRILVKPDKMDDAEASNLARKVAKEIEETLVYPGQIKVTVIRESRSVEYAK
jgi:ribonuclease Y